MAQLKEFTLHRGLTVQIKMSLVTAWTGRMTVLIVSGLAANCSTLWCAQQLRRSCLRNCWTSGWQQAFECQQNTFVWHERRWRYV